MHRTPERSCLLLSAKVQKHRCGWGWDSISWALFIPSKQARSDLEAVWLQPVMAVVASMQPKLGWIWFSSLFPKKAGIVLYTNLDLMWMAWSGFGQTDLVWKQASMQEWSGLVSSRMKMAHYQFPTFRLGCVLPQTSQIILYETSLKASLCARLIWPVSGQHFQADPDPMRIRSSMFTGYILCLGEGGKRVVMAVALAWCDGGLAVYVALVDSCQPGVHFRVSLPETRAGFPEVLSLTLNWHSIMFVVCLFFSVSSLHLFCLLQLWLTQLYFVGKGAIILLLFFSCRQCSQSLLMGSHT